MLAGDIISILEACSFGPWGDPRSLLSRFEAAEPLHTGQVVRLIESRSGAAVEVVAASPEDDYPPIGIVVRPHPDGQVDVSNATMLNVLMPPGEAQSSSVGSYVYLTDGGKCTLTPSRVRMGVLVQHSQHNFAQIQFQPMVLNG